MSDPLEPARRLASRLPSGPRAASPETVSRSVTEPSVSAFRVDLVAGPLAGQRAEMGQGAFEMTVDAADGSLHRVRLTALGRSVTVEPVTGQLRAAGEEVKGQRNCLGTIFAVGPHRFRVGPAGTRLSRRSASAAGSGPDRAVLLPDPSDLDDNEGNDVAERWRRHLTPDRRTSGLRSAVAGTLVVVALAERSEGGDETVPLLVDLRNPLIIEGPVEWSRSVARWLLVATDQTVFDVEAAGPALRSLGGGRSRDDAAVVVSVSESLFGGPVIDETWDGADAETDDETGPAARRALIRFRPHTGPDASACGMRLVVSADGCVVTDLDRNRSSERHYTACTFVGIDGATADEILTGTVAEPATRGWALTPVRPAPARPARKVGVGAMRPLALPRGRRRPVLVGAGVLTGAMVATAALYVGSTRLEQPESLAFADRVELFGTAGPDVAVTLFLTSGETDRRMLVGEAVADATGDYQLPVDAALWAEERCFDVVFAAPDELRFEPAEPGAEPTRLNWQSWCPAGPEDTTVPGPTAQLIDG